MNRVRGIPPLEYVKVKRGQTGDIEAREPHGADNGDPEWVRFLLEGGIKVDAFPVLKFNSILIILKAWFMLAPGSGFLLFGPSNNQGGGSYA